MTSDVLVVARPIWDSLREEILQTVQSCHQNYPLRRGIPREELKSRIRLSSRAFNASINTLVAGQLLVDQAAFLASPSHEIRFDSVQQGKVAGLIRKFEQNPYGPPSMKECQAEVGEEILNALIGQGQLVAVSPEVIFRKQDYEVMVGRVSQEILQKGRITLSEVRDLFNTSRKYAQALLEHLDAVGLTVREGDARRLKQKS